MLSAEDTVFVQNIGNTKKKRLCGIPKEEGEYVVVSLTGGVPQRYPSILASHAAHLNPH
jgi:hypothetical protein